MLLQNCLVSTIHLFKASHSSSKIKSCGDLHLHAGPLAWKFYKCLLIMWCEKYMTIPFFKSLFPTLHDGILHLLTFRSLYRNRWEKKDRNTLNVMHECELSIQQSYVPSTVFIWEYIKWRLTHNFRTVITHEYSWTHGIYSSLLLWNPRTFLSPREKKKNTCEIVCFSSYFCHAPACQRHVKCWKGRLISFLPFMMKGKLLVFSTYFTAKYF